MNIRIVLIVLCFLASMSASAAPCSDLLNSIRIARSELKNASSQTDLERGKRYARNAEQALNDANKEVSDCACYTVQQKFKRAALYARHAKIAKDSSRFSVELKSSIREVDSANRLLRQCDSK